MQRVDEIAAKTALLSTPAQEAMMEVLYPRCAGLDMHKDTVVACVRIAEGGRVRLEVRTFGTTAGPLLELQDWLMSEGVTHVVMEATGVYWKPVWHVLDENAVLVLANAQQVKALPGRKSDVNDAQWLADLLAHGLVRGGFVPPEPIQQLRDLTRTRVQLVRQRAQHMQRIQKVLEDANVKLASVVTDILGKSGRAILEAIIRGEKDPLALAKLADPRVKASREVLAEALRGRVTDHHRFMLRAHLAQIDGTGRSIAEFEAEVAKQLQPFRAQVERLKTIPGVSDTVATVIVAEIGVDMKQFPSDDHLISWAGLCPRSDESAGKRRSTRIRKGAPWLKPILVQAAWAAVRTKNSYERSLFYRIRSHSGPKTAIIAVCHSMLQAAYFILRNGVEYRSLGSDHLDRVNEERTKRRLIQRLEKLGYIVEIKNVA